MIPSQFDTYYEPFLGGGAMFFCLVSRGTKFNTAYLSDSNVELITAYEVIKVNPKGVIEFLQTYDIEYKKYPPYSKQQKEYYNQLKDARNKKMELSSDIELAARFIALNRTCIVLAHYPSFTEFRKRVSKYFRTKRFKLNMRAYLLGSVS